MAGEDFGEFGRAANAPSLMFWLGATPAPVIAAAGGDPTRLPSLHSPLWAPDPEPTIKTGSAALVGVVAGAVFAVAAVALLLALRRRRTPPTRPEAAI